MQVTNYTSIILDGKRYFLYIPVLFLLRGSHYVTLLYRYAIFTSVLLIYSYPNPLPHACFIYLVLFFFLMGIPRTGKSAFKTITCLTESAFALMLQSGLPVDKEVQGSRLGWSQEIWKECSHIQCLHALTSPALLLGLLFPHRGRHRVLGSTAHGPQPTPAELAVPGEGTCMQTTTLAWKPGGQTQSGPEKEVWEACCWQNLLQQPEAKVGMIKQRTGDGYWTWYSLLHIMYLTLAALLKTREKEYCLPAENSHELHLQEWRSCICTSEDRNRLSVLKAEDFKAWWHLYLPPDAEQTGPQIICIGR